MIPNPDKQSANFLTVMIVDDEPLAIEYLRNTIDWERFGYRIIAEATETPAAIKAFRLHRPQIVLSDIRIPGIDGLEMCRELLITDPAVKIILITAYSEFSYAKKAMEMGIHQYILKHEISEKRLIEELGKAGKEIRIESNENRILARSVIVDSLSDRQSRLEESGPQRKILEKMGRTIILLLLRQDYPYILPEEQQYGKDSDGMMDNLQDLPLPDGYGYFGCLQIEQGVQTHLITHRDFLPRKRVKSELGTLIRNHVLVRDGKDYSVVILTSGIGLTNLNDAYQNALKKFDGFPFLGPGNLVFLEDRTPRSQSEEGQFDIDAYLTGIAASLGAFEIQNATTTIRKLFGRFVSPENQPDILRNTIHLLVRIIDDWALLNHLVPMDRSLLAECRSMDELPGTFENAIEDMSQEFNSASPIYSPKINKAILFINRNYSKNLSVSEIAEELGISESNLSKSFRQETGQSVLDYLTGIRIKVAKRLLVRTSLKIYQISEMTGYSTSGYFGRVFLKEVQMPPLEYRTRKAGSFD